MILQVDVVNKIATFQKRGGRIVCGNSDYKIKFTFDSEWNEYTVKTARFIWGGHYTDRVFTGDICDVPVMYDTAVVDVGVYAGDLATVTDESTVDLKTTTNATIECCRSILCDNITPSPENDRLHANEAKEAAARAEVAAEEATERVEEAVKFATDKVEAATNEAAERAEAAAVKAEEAAARAELEGGVNKEYESRLTAIENQLNYKQISASLTANGVYSMSAEVGQVVKDVKLAWSITKEAKEIVLSGVDTNDVYLDTHTDNGEPILKGTRVDSRSHTEDHKWKIAATEKHSKNADTKPHTSQAEVSLTFYNRVYWGIGTITGEGEDTFTSDFVLGLAVEGAGGGTERTNSKSRTFSVTPNNQYIYYVTPTSWYPDGKQPTFKMDDGFAGGFNAGVEVEVTRTFSDNTTAKINCYVYRSMERIKDPDGEPTKVAVS